MTPSDRISSMAADAILDLCEELTRRTYAQFLTPTVEAWPTCEKCSDDVVHESTLCPYHLEQKYQGEAADDAYRRWQDDEMRGGF